MLQRGLDKFARLTCWWRYGRLLSVYLDNELDGHAAETIASHLRECNRCRAEFEQLHSASRALVEFEIPPMRSPAFGGNVFRLPELKGPPTFRRIFSQKITLPLPSAAGLVIALISATWIVTSRSESTPVQSKVSVAEPPPSVITRVVEVPVERVVTRTVYFRRSGPGRTRGPKENNVTITPNSKKDIAQNDARLAEWPDSSLKDFRPAASANLRVVKEH